MELKCNKNNKVYLMTPGQSQQEIGSNNKEPIDEATTKIMSSCTGSIEIHYGEKNLKAHINLCTIVLTLSIPSTLPMLWVSTSN